jgi:hypothetical protein
MPVYGLWLFSMIYGLDWIASGPPTVRFLSSIVGAERIGIMVAWITVIHQIGSASAAYLAGVLRIAFGTYLEAFMMSGMLLLVAAIMGPLHRRRPPQPRAGGHSDRSAVMPQITRPASLYRVQLVNSYKYSGLRF